MHTPPIPPNPGDVYCFDTNALINLHSRKLLKRLRQLAQSGRLKIPERVLTESKDKVGKLTRVLHQWNKKYSIVAPLNQMAVNFLPVIEERYGKPFRIGRDSYPGLWHGVRGPKSADAQLVALAKARNWIVISDDKSVSRVCIEKGVHCLSWTVFAQGPI